MPKSNQVDFASLALRADRWPVQNGRPFFLPREPPKVDRGHSFRTLQDTGRCPHSVRATRHPASSSGGRFQMASPRRSHPVLSLPVRTRAFISIFQAAHQSFTPVRSATRSMMSGATLRHSRFSRKPPTGFPAPARTPVSTATMPSATGSPPSPPKPWPRSARPRERDRSTRRRSCSRSTRRSDAQI